jgi:competence protein ComGC
LLLLLVLGTLQEIALLLLLLLLLQLLPALQKQAEVVVGWGCRQPVETFGAHRLNQG